MQKIPLCLAAALEYLERGWSVLPLCSPDHRGMTGQHEQTCRSMGKAPICAWKGYQDRLPRPAEVRLWWSRWPTANVGMALGPVSGLLGLDIDGSAGEALLQKLMQQAGVTELPETLEFLTPGGRRPLFAWPDGVQLPNEEYKLGDGELRVLCKGRQTVMPPSVHANGGEYVWVEGHRPGEIAPAPCPEWLLQILLQPKIAPIDAQKLAVEKEYYRGRVPHSAIAKFERARRYLREMGPCHPEPSHPMDASTHLLKAATAMWGLDFDENEAVELLTEWDQDNAVSPYPEKELRRKYHEAAARCGKSKGYLLTQPGSDAHAAADKTSAHPIHGTPPYAEDVGSQPSAAKPKAARPAKKTLRVPAPYQPFPIAALPDPINTYVEQGALALGCDPAYVALPALAVAASAIGNTRTIRLKRGWEEPAIVWSVLVAESGTLKSPAWLKAVGHLFATQRRLLSDHRTDYQAYEAAVEQQATARKSGIEPRDVPEEPHLRRVICSDTTIEKLAEILDQNARGILLARDELQGWFGSFTRYKGRFGSSDLPNWLEMFRAGTIIVDRKTSERQTLFIKRAAVSVTGSIQPGMLARALVGDFLDAGLAARLLMAMPPKLPKRWSEMEIHPDVERSYQNTLDRLLALQLERDNDGDMAPYMLRLSPEAKAAWVSFYNDWGARQAEAEGDVAAALSKLEAYAARFAMLHHVVNCASRNLDDHAPVELGSIEAGVQLCRWFAAESSRVYLLLSESDDERGTRRLIDFIESRGGRITIRELMRANCRRYPDTETAEAALAELVEAGLGRWEENQPEGVGRPTKAFHLCMTHDAHDTIQDVPDNLQDSA